MLHFVLTGNSVAGRSPSHRCCSFQFCLYYWHVFLSSEIESSLICLFSLNRISVYISRCLSSLYITLTDGIPNSVSQISFWNHRLVSLNSQLLYFLELLEFLYRSVQFKSQLRILAEYVLRFWDLSCGSQLYSIPPLFSSVLEALNSNIWLPILVKLVCCEEALLPISADLETSLKWVEGDINLVLILYSSLCSGILTPVVIT